MLLIRFFRNQVTGEIDQTSPPRKVNMMVRSCYMIWYNMIYELIFVCTNSRPKLALTFWSHGCRCGSHRERWAAVCGWLWSYSQVSTGDKHSVLARSDGQVVACGQNFHEQRDIPPLDGVSSRSRLVIVIASFSGVMVESWLVVPLMRNRRFGSWHVIHSSFCGRHTVLPRSDGCAPLEWIWKKNARFQTAFTILPTQRLLEFGRWGIPSALGEPQAQLGTVAELIKRTNGCWLFLLLCPEKSPPEAKLAKY